MKCAWLLNAGNNIGTKENKPLGQPTRGKTAENRLRRVDNFILLYEPSVLTRTDGLYSDSIFLDLGYGVDPRTTLESASRFRKLNPKLRIIGVEIDKERVEAALPYADEITNFRMGGFNLPLQTGESVRLIRAFNVLRQYEEADFAPAYEHLAEYTLSGGLMIEGTSTPFGNLWCANLVRRLESRSKLLENRPQSVGFQSYWKLEAFVFSTNFHSGFDVEEFQTILPKNLIHHMVEGEPIYDFFETWKRSAAETSSAKVFGLKNWFVSAAESLEQKGYKINTQRKFLSKGYLIWEQ